MEGTEALLDAIGSIYGTILVNGGSSDSGLWVRSAGVDYYFSGADHNSSTAHSANTWYHGGLSVSAGAGTWYLNGRPDGSVSVSVMFGSATVALLANTIV